MLKGAFLCLGSIVA